jgi:hypothetical protein
MVMYQNQARKASVQGAMQKIREMPRASDTKIKKMKTADGFILRIETGAESIDIRISEDDLIIEGKDRKNEDH